MQDPSLGRIVLVRGLDPKAHNGTTEAPAVITRVWSESPPGSGQWLVNLTLFADAMSPYPLTSRNFFADEDRIEHFLETSQPLLEQGHFVPYAIYPPRV